MKRQVPHKVGGRFFLQELITRTPDCDVYRGEHVALRKAVAIKIEAIHNPRNRLASEHIIYNSLKDLPGIPTVDWYGSEGDYDILVLELVGRNLEQVLQDMPTHTFTMKTVLMIAEQLLGIIEYIHRSNYVYRNFAPDNLAIGVGRKEGNVYMLGLGSSRRYLDPETQEHERYDGDRSMVGNPIYTSLNTHVGVEQTRRDDMESLGYVLVHLLKGKLPWEDGVGGDIEQIARAKMMTSYEKLCEGLPTEFLNYFQVVRSLRFDEEPPYAALKKSFRELFVRLGYVYDFKYDWNQDLGRRKPDRAKTVPKIHAPLFDNTEFGLTNDGLGSWMTPPRKLVSSQMLLRPSPRSGLNLKAKKRVAIVSRRSLTLHDFGLNELERSAQNTPQRHRVVHTFSARSKP